MAKYNTVAKRIVAAIIDGIVFLPFSFTDSLISNNRLYFFIVGLLYLLLWSIYTLVLHCHYGQTLGKKIMEIKLYNIDEIHTLSFKRAFLRESIWIVGQLFILIFFTIKSLKDPQINEEILENYGDCAGLLTMLWITIELITVLTNSKKRSIQDFIANSVVLKVN